MGKLTGGGGGGNAHYSNHGFDGDSDGKSGVTLTSVVVNSSEEDVKKSSGGSNKVAPSDGENGGGQWRERVLHTLGPDEEKKLGTR